jgi:hypothetical protein
MVTSWKTLLHSGQYPFCISSHYPSDTVTSALYLWNHILMWVARCSTHMRGLWMCNILPQLATMQCSFCTCILKCNGFAHYSCLMLYPSLLLYHFLTLSPVCNMSPWQYHSSLLLLEWKEWSITVACPSWYIKKLRDWKSMICNNFPYVYFST